MNKKKIIILIILFVAIAGLALAPVSAATKTYKTGKLYFKQDKDKRYSFTPTIKINKNTEIGGCYVYPKVDSQYEPNTVYVGTNKYMGEIADYRATKIIIKFKKKVNGKTFYSTKTFYYNKPKKEWLYGELTYKPKNNYQPYYCIVYYKKIK